MSPRRVAVFVALGLTVLLPAACSRSSDDEPDDAPGASTTSTTARPTTTAAGDRPTGSGNEAFAAAADAACAAALAELDEVAAPTDERSIAEYLDRAYDILDDLGQQLGSLDAPAGSEPSVERLLGTLASEVLALREARAAHDAGNAAERDRRFEDVARLEREFGAQAQVMLLSGCGRFAEPR